MKDERNDPRNGNREENGAQRGSNNDPRQRPGPFTSAVGWLGGAFNRSQVNKREADERRRRNM